MNDRIYNKITTDKRQAIIEMHLQKMTIKQIEGETNLPKTTIASIINVFKTEFRIEAKNKGGDLRSTVSQDEKDIIHDIVYTNCSLTLNQYLKRISSVGIKITKSALQRILKSFYFTITPINLENIKNDEKTLNERYKFASILSGFVGDHSYKKVFYIEETCFSVRSRLKIHQNHDQYRTEHKESINSSSCVTLTSVICKMGLIYNQFSTDSHMADNFIIFIDNFLNYLTKLNLKNCIIISSHPDFYNSTAIHNMIISKSHVLIYIPTHSLMFNPLFNITDDINCIFRNSNFKNEDEVFNYLISAFKTTVSTKLDFYFMRMMDYLHMALKKEPIFN